MDGQKARIELLGMALLLSVAAFAHAQPVTSSQLESALEQLSHRDPAVRASAAERLGRRGAAQRDAIVPALRRTLRDDADWRVRASCGRALGRLGAREAVPDLVRALRDPVVDVRVVAAAALWRLPDPAAVPALLELLRDRDAAARQWGALALGVTRDRRATQPLIGLLDDPERDVRLDVIRSLRRIRDPAAVSALEAFAADAARAQEERLEAVDALAGLEGPEKVDALVRLARHAHAPLRIRAVEALGRVGDALVVSALRERRRVERAPAVQRAIDQAIREIEARATGHSPSGGSPLALPPL